MLLSVPVYLLLLFSYGVLVPEKLLNTNLVSRRVTTGFTAERMKEVAPTGNVDVLFLGSSHCNRGFDTRFFSDKGIKTFNLGSSSQTPSQSQALLKTYLPRLKPRLVVFEMFPLCFGMDGVESSIDFISNGFIPAEFAEPVLHQNNMKVYNTLAFFSLSSLTGRQADFRKMDPDDQYIAGGFVSRKLSYYTTQTKAPEKWKTEAFQVNAFKESLRMVRESGADILLVYAPVSPIFYKAYTNQDSLAGELTRGYDYIDFNKELSLNDSLHFYDAHHMNSLGVAAFSNALLPQIEIRLKSKN